MIFESYELGENIIIRDAYIFAAPIVCDVESAQGKYIAFNPKRNGTYDSSLPPLAFNNRMNHRQDHLRTMWRITNVKEFTNFSVVQLLIQYQHLHV